eukprot:comp22691_c0_seq2/m.35146 comp22691_c0_seq2/g.35146  ORF comp22691_c0_seq2/g.35146 comp22691_c0_seq2/m.35146 type:complete len:910 (-) comp22691_c0_seq2:37-2766(-)
MGRKVVSYLEGEPELLPYAALFNPILGRIDERADEPTLHIPESPVVQAMELRVRREKGVWLVSQVIKSYLKGKPAVFVLDDAHWFDSSSWAVSQILCFKFTHLVVVICSRPVLRMGGATFPEYLRILESPSTQILFLRPMENEDIRKVAALYFEVLEDNVPEEVVNVLHDKSHGHPQFAQELVTQMLAKKIVEVSNGTLRILEHAALQNIETKGIEGVITSQLDQIREDQKLAVKVAACIGREFTAEMLLDIIRTIPNHQQTTMEELKENLLVIMKHIDLEYDEENQAYVFPNKTTPDVALSLLLLKHKKEIHSAIANWLKEKKAADLVPHYPTIAYHLSKSQSYADACTYLDKAAVNAAKINSHWEVIRFLHEAFLLDANHLNNSNRDRYPMWEHLLGQAYFGMGKMNDAKDHIIRALELMGAFVPKSTTAVKLALFGRALGQHALRQLFNASASVPSQPRTRQEFLSVLEQNPKMQRTYKLCESWLTLAKISYLMQDGHQMLFAAINAVHLGFEMEVCQLHVDGWAFLGFAMGVVKGKHRTTDQYHDKALRLSEHLKDPTMGRVWCYHGFYLIGIGYLEEATTMLEKAIKGMEESSDIWGMDEARFVLSVIYFWSGKSKSAWGQVQTLTDAAKSRGEVRSRVFAHSMATTLLLGQGDHVQCERQATEALPLCTTTCEADHFLIQCKMAILKIRARNFRLANTHAEEAYALLETFDMPVAVFLLDGYYTLALVFLALAEDARENKQPTLALVKRVQKVVEKLSEFANRHPVATPALALASGMLEAHRGTIKKSIEIMERGFKRAQRLKMTHYEGLLSLQLMELFGSEGCALDKDNKRAMYGAHALRVFQISQQDYYINRYHLSEFQLVSTTALERAPTEGIEASESEDEATVTDMNRVGSQGDAPPVL